jgi:hypothetical protein
MREFRRVFGVLALGVSIAVLGGCGGDSSTGAGSTESFTQPGSYAGVKGPTREFIIPGGDNSVQLYGDEASTPERLKASKVAHIWMKARVAENWDTDCKHLSRVYIKALVADARGVTGGKVKSCPQALAYFGDAASGTSGNTLTGSIDSLRVKKPVGSNTELEAYAQWHGPEKDWVLPMAREDGVWKVAIAAPLDREK